MRDKNNRIRGTMTMKSMIIKGAKACAVLGLCLSTFPAFATNGYFANGYGSQSKSMAGAGAAVSTGVLGMAQNPATGVRVGNSAGFCLTTFAPNRSVRVAPAGR